MARAWARNEIEPPSEVIDYKIIMPGFLGAGDQTQGPACPACVFGQHPQTPEGFRFSGTGVTDGWDPPYQCWELNVGPGEWPVLLTLVSPL